MRFRSAWIVAVSADLLLCVGCATDYHARGASGGYSETQFGENVFQVQFHSNEYTSAERTTDFALLRSADVALQHGSPYFMIVDSANGADTTTITIPPSASTTFDATGNTIGNYTIASGTATTTYSPGETRTISSKPNTTNTIALYKGRPVDAGLVYEAAQVEQSIRSKYHLKGTPPAPAAVAGPAPSTIPTVARNNASPAPVY
jgi:hypothetical protein